MSFNPATYAVAGFVDVTHMSRENRKRLAQNDDQPVMVRAMAKVVAQPSAHIANWVMHLEQAAARFNVRRDNFAAGKGSTCLDIASKLEHFGDFASEAQKSFAYKLVGWSAGYGQAHPMEAPAKAPASPVAAPAPVAPAVTLPKLHEVMQKHAKFYVGGVTLARKQGDQLVWVKHADYEGVVGKLDNAVLTLYSRPGIDTNDVRSLLLELEADPLAAARKYGKLSGRCCSCGADLVDPESIARGQGPICAGKF